MTEHGAGFAGPSHPESRPTAASSKKLPVIACSLAAEQLPERRRRWRALTERSLVGRTAIPDGVGLNFRAAPGVEQELRALAELERGCCAFATFEVSTSGGHVTLEVTSAGDGVAAVRELFS